MAKLETITGKTISGEWGLDDETGDGIPVLRTTNFTNEGIINYSNVITRNILKKDLSLKFLQPGDIIIEKSGGSDTQPVGRVVYFAGKANTYLFNNFTGVLRIKDSSRWDTKYLFYVLYANYLKGGTRKYQNKTTGLHNLKTDQFVREFEVCEYSIPKQQHIVAVLDKVSDLIVLRKQQINKLDELVKSRFVEMFGDPVQNPLKWKLKPLLDMGFCKNGMNFHNDDSGVEVHCLGVGDFKDLTVISDTTSLPMVALNEMPSDEYLLQDGDIVFVRSNGNKALVGRSVAIYPGNIPTTFSGFCIRYRKVDKSVTVPYLLRVLKMDSMRKKMTGRGANIQNLNQQILGTLNIPIPPFDIQEQFVDFVQQTNISKSTLQKSLEKLETLKKALMQQYFG